MVKSFWTSRVTCCSEQEKRSGGQKRQKHSENAESYKKCSCNNQYPSNQSIRYFVYFAGIIITLPIVIFFHYRSYIRFRLTPRLQPQCACLPVGRDFTYWFFSLPLSFADLVNAGLRKPPALLGCRHVTGISFIPLLTPELFGCVIQGFYSWQHHRRLNNLYT